MEKGYLKTLVNLQVSLKYPKMRVLRGLKTHKCTAGGQVVSSSQPTPPGPASLSVLDN